MTALLRPSLLPAWCFLAVLALVPNRPAAAQEVLPMTTYCAFEGDRLPGELSVQPPSEEILGAIGMIQEAAGFRVDVELRAASVASFVAARDGETKYLLHNPYLAAPLPHATGTRGRGSRTCSRTTSSITRSIGSSSVRSRRSRPISSRDRSWPAWTCRSKRSAT